MNQETPAGYTPQTVNQKSHLPPTWPLRISPNLEALLQGEEQMRTLEVAKSNDFEHVTGLPVAPSPEFMFGLPPPPRGPRRQKLHRSLSARSSKSHSLASECVRSASPPLQPPVSQSRLITNSYINPTPALDGVLRRNCSTFGHTLKAPYTRTVIDGSVASHEDDGWYESTQMVQPYVGRALPCSPNDQGAYLYPDNSWSKRQSLANIKDSFGKVVVAETQNEQERVKNVVPPFLATEHRVISSLATVRVRNRGRPASHRPVISHGNNSSVCSYDLGSTHAPVSVINHGRSISLSSTLYPSSSAHQSLYDRPPLSPDSYMESYSPANLQFINAAFDMTHPTPGDIQFSQSSISERPHNDCSTTTLLTTSKPTAPTMPTTLTSGMSTNNSDSSQRTRLPPLPPTTNFLDTEERADLVRKSRKLARLFGETPGADAMAQQESGRSTHNMFIRKGILDPSATSPWRYSSDSIRLSGGRRHSLPTSPDDVSLFSMAAPVFDNNHSPLIPTFHIPDQTPTPSSGADQATQRATLPVRPALPLSFMDFSESAADAAAISSEAESPFVFSPDSISEALSINLADEPAEAQRKRKRERLAKLHRFLGSHVPAHLVLGIDDHEASLPPIRPIPFPGMTCSENDDIYERPWMNRRKSSPATVLSRELKAFERRREELDGKEKAINVRRAQKMEKVFGVAPPQTLYHTRHSPSPSPPPAKGVPSHPTVAASFLPPMETSNPLQRNLNRSSYIKPKSKKNNRRPSTSESNHLLPKDQGSLDAGDHFTHGKQSFTYTHYQHSLNSLNIIIDRDDKESLAELHQYLSTGNLAAPELLKAGNRRPSNASSTRSERRRSLPSTTSMISLESEYSITSPTGDISSFQIRRRSAAKLTQFFGVNYRELITQVLESIETGVEQEQQKGTLRAEEVEDLLAKLGNLKVKRQNFV